MDQISTVLLLKAMDGLSLRAEATAANIANANTPGYRPVRVSFEEALAQAAGRGEGAVRAVTPQLVKPTAEAGLVRLDLEMAQASSTAARYAALAELLGRQSQIMARAVTGGR